jgi:hypothetical protein
MNHGAAQSRRIPRGRIRPGAEEITTRYRQDAMTGRYDLRQTRPRWQRHVLESHNLPAPRGSVDSDQLAVLQITPIRCEIRLKRQVHQPSSRNVIHACRRSRVSSAIQRMQQGMRALTATP